ACHLVAVDFNDGRFHLDFGHERLIPEEMRAAHLNDGAGQGQAGLSSLPRYPEVALDDAVKDHRIDFAPERKGSGYSIDVAIRQSGHSLRSQFCGSARANRPDAS